MGLTWQRQIQLEDAEMVENMIGERFDTLKLGEVCYLLGMETEQKRALETLTLKQSE
jgi:hypothetical protein